MDDGQLFCQVGEYLRPLLAGADAPTALEAARAALTIAPHADGALAPLASAAMAALADLWDVPGQEPARAQILETITEGLPMLEVCPSWVHHLVVMPSACQ